MTAPVSGSAIKTAACWSSRSVCRRRNFRLLPAVRPAPTAQARRGISYHSPDEVFGCSFLIDQEFPIFHLEYRSAVSCCNWRC